MTFWNDLYAISLLPRYYYTQIFVANHSFLFKLLLSPIKPIEYLYQFLWWLHCLHILPVSPHPTKSNYNRSKWSKWPDKVESSHCLAVALSSEEMFVASSWLSSHCKIPNTTFQSPRMRNPTSLSSLSSITTNHENNLSKCKQALAWLS